MAFSVDTTASFAARLRTETDVHHREAEASPFVDALLDGRLSVAAYAALASQHWFVYEALERVAERWVGDPVIGDFVDPRLHRLPHLQRDLAVLWGADWGERIEALSATERYVARIEDHGGSDPAAFLAHHYLRYLGDVSGGQAIAVALRRHYGLADREGTAFYRFDHVCSPRDVRESYRARLDAAPLSPAQQQGMIEEVGAAYRCNTELFADLGRVHLAAGTVTVEHRPEPST